MSFIYDVIQGETETIGSAVVKVQNYFECPLYIWSETGTYFSQFRVMRIVMCQIYCTKLVSNQTS